MSVPSECEIVQDMVEIDHMGGVNCSVCSTASNAIGGKNEAAVVAVAELDSSGSASASALVLSAEVCEQTISVTSCTELKAGIEETAGGGVGGSASCPFYIENNITCNTAITVRSGQNISVSAEITGGGGGFSWISAVSPFATPSTSEPQVGASIFVVEAGGELALQSVGFNNEALTDDVRVVHNYGKLYVSNCEWDGRKPEGADIWSSEYGGAVSCPSGHARVVPCALYCVLYCVL